MSKIQEEDRREICVVGKEEKHFRPTLYFSEKVYHTFLVFNAESSHIKNTENTVIIHKIMKLSQIQKSQTECFIISTTDEGLLDLCVGLGGIDIEIDR